MQRLTKWLSMFLAFALVLTISPSLTAFARSQNSVDRVVTVSDSFSGPLNVTVEIKEDSDYPNDFQNGDVFWLKLPAPAKWNNTTNATIEDSTVTGSVYSLSIQSIDPQTIAVTINNTSANADVIKIYPDVDVNGFSGDLTLTIDPRDSAVTPETLTIAKAIGGKASVSVDEVKTIGEAGKGGNIIIDEAAVGQLKGYQKLTLKLPPNFEWDATQTDVKFVGGYTGARYSKTADGRTLTLEFNNLPTTSLVRGTIVITPYIKAGSGAPYGEVSVSLSSSTGDIPSKDLVIAKYADWGISAEVSEVKDLIAGKLNDQMTAKIKIKENIANSLIDGRRLRVELPDWVKILAVNEWSPNSTFNNISTPSVDGKTNYFEVTVNRSNTTSKGSIEFKLELSIEGNRSGDITAKISSAGVNTVELVVAKAVTPVTVETGKAADVKIGVQGQDAPDLIIKENYKSVVKQTVDKNTYNYDGSIFVRMPVGVYFANTPTVTVVDGDLEIRADQVKVVDDKVLVIPVKSESTKPSTIKISNMKITLDRTVPEGDLKVEVGGNAIIENSGQPGALGPGEFTTDAIKAKFANTVTPAPGEMTRSAAFKIDSMTYVVDGVEKVMDVAPFIKDNRTFVPVKYVAEALGVKDTDIIWNPYAKSVTIFKGDRVIQMKIGSKALLVNGATIEMDTAPEIKDARTVLPIAWVAKALNVDYAWNDLERSVEFTYVSR